MTACTEGFGVIAEPPQKLPVAVPVYAVIQFDGSARRVSEVVVAFENVPAAVRFATDSGLKDYTVAPIGFHVGRQTGRDRDAEPDREAGPDRQAGRRGSGRVR